MLRFLKLIQVMRALYHRFLGMSYRRTYKIASETQLGVVSFNVEKCSSVLIGAKKLGESFAGALPTIISQKYDARIQVDEGVTIRDGVRIVAQGSGAINIGRNSTINEQTFLKTFGAGSITVGQECVISWNCQFIANDFHVLQINNVDRPFVDDIVIGNHCWIGANVIILKGARLGNNCVVGAGAVVNGCFPDGALIVGIPGRIVKTDVSWRNLTNSEKRGLPDLTKESSIPGVLATEAPK